MVLEQVKQSSLIQGGSAWAQGSSAFICAQTGTHLVPAGVQVNGNTSSEKLKEVVLYFPLLMIREQEHAFPASVCHSHWSAEGQPSATQSLTPWHEGL